MMQWTLPQTVDVGVMSYPIIGSFAASIRWWSQIRKHDKEIRQNLIEAILARRSWERKYLSHLKWNALSFLLLSNATCSLLILVSSESLSLKCSRIVNLASLVIFVRLLPNTDRNTMANFEQLFLQELVDHPGLTGHNECWMTLTCDPRKMIREEIDLLISSSSIFLPIISWP